MKKRNIIILIVVILIIVVISFTIYYIKNKNNSNLNQTNNTEIDTTESDTTESNTSESEPTGSDLTTETTNQSYSITTETYSQDSSQNNIKIQYPQMTGLKDTSMENTVNELIKNDIDESYENYMIVDGLNLNRTYQITMNTNDFLSILYTVNSNINGSNWHTTLIGRTIDLKTGTELQLSDFVTIDTDLVRKIKQTTEFANPAVNNGMDKNKIISYIQQLLDLDMIYGLENGTGSCTFFLTPDSLVISVGLPDDLGTYALIEFPDQNMPK